MVFSSRKASIFSTGTLVLISATSFRGSSDVHELDSFGKEEYSRTSYNDRALSLLFLRPCLFSGRRGFPPWPDGVDESSIFADEILGGPPSAILNTSGAGLLHPRALRRKHFW